MTGGEKGAALKDLSVSLELRGKPEVGDREEKLPNPENSRQSLMLFVSQWVKTDGEGRFAFWTCPGDYYTDTQVGGERNMQNFILKAGDVEHEVAIHGDHAAPVAGVFHGRVVRADQPGVGVGEAKLEGQPADFGNHGMVDPAGVTDKNGNFELRRCDSEVYLFAASPDEKLKGLALVEVGVENVVVPVDATTTARGRLVDGSGKRVGGERVKFGIQIEDEKGKGITTMRWGGEVVAGADGGFVVAGLIPGQEYQLDVVEGTEGEQHYWEVGTVIAEKGREADAGELRYPPDRRRR